MILGYSIIQVSRYLILCLGFVLSSWGYGLPIIRLVRGRFPLSIENHLFSLALGMGIIGHLTLVLGSIFPLNKQLAIIILAGGCLLGLIQLYRNKNNYFQLWKIPPIRITVVPLILIGSMILIITANCIYPIVANAIVPPHVYDEVAYHLAVPKIYIQQGRISYISFIPYSNWPMETEMLFTLGLLIDAEKFAHFVTWFDFLLICFVLILLGKRFFNAQTGMIAALIFSATPVVTSIAGTGLIEIPLSLYCFLAGATFLEWIETQQNSDWILSAIFAGLAASTKLNAAIVPVIIGVLLMIIGAIRRESMLANLKRFAIYGMLAFLVVCPWYVKSWIQTGDPFWSFFMGIFPVRNWDALGAHYLFGFIKKPNLPLSLANYFRAFWIISAKAYTIGPDSFRLGWVYLILIPFSFVTCFLIIRKQRRIIAWMLALSLAFYTSWFLQTHQARFLTPALPILALCCSTGVDWLISKSTGYLKLIPLSALLMVVIANSWISTPAERNLLKTNWPYIAGKISRQTYLESQISGYQVFSYVNQLLPSDTYIWMALYESRGYYLDRRYMWANPINQRVIKLEQFHNANELANSLLDQGFSYVLYNKVDTDKYNSIEYGDKYARLMNDLIQQRMNRIYDFGDLELYKLIP